MTISNVGSAVVDKQRSATCSLRAGTRLGCRRRYRLAVTVAIESGSKASGSFPFTVVPDRLISAGRGAPSGRAAAHLGGGQLGAVAGAEAEGA